MHVWSHQPKARFQALSAIRGRIFTAQDGVCLQEIVGDEIRSVPGGDSYRNSRKLFLNPSMRVTILVSQVLFPGTGKVAVATPAPGGGTSNASRIPYMLPIVSNSTVYNQSMARGTL